MFQVNYKDPSMDEFDEPTVCKTIDEVRQYLGSLLRDMQSDFGKGFIQLNHPTDGEILQGCWVSYQLDGETLESCTEITKAKVW